MEFGRLLRVPKELAEDQDANKQHSLGAHEVIDRCDEDSELCASIDEQRNRDQRTKYKEVISIPPTEVLASEGERMRSPSEIGINFLECSCP